MPAPAGSHSSFVIASLEGANMKIMIVTDAWEPQVNGVVRTLRAAVQ